MVAVILDDNERCVMLGPYGEFPILGNTEVVKVFTNNPELFNQLLVVGDFGIHPFHQYIDA